jgi:hypothetical protein
MTKDEMLKLMGLIAIEFGSRFEVSEERLMLWGEIIGGVDFPTAKKAVISVIGECSDFPPNVGKVREEISEIRLRQNRELKRIASEAPAPIKPVDPIVLEKNKKMLRDFLEKTASKVKGIQ